MRKFVRLISLVALAFISLSPIRGAAQEVELQTGFHIDWWTNSDDLSGKQVYAPVMLGVRYDDFAFRVLTGEAYTSATRTDVFNESLSHWLDTKVNFSYEIAGKLPVDILIGLDFNLPTGKTDLTTGQNALVLDPDLVSITRFGEGFNVNPTIIFSKQWGEKLVTGIGFGYNFRGEYDFNTLAQDYDPGDVFSVVPEIRYNFAPEWIARLFLNYTTFDRAEWRNPQLTENDLYQQGDFYMLGLGLNYQQARWAAGATFKAMALRDDETSIWRKDHMDFSDNGLSPEGQDYVLELALKYLLTDKVTIKSVLHFEYIDEWPLDCNRYIYADRFFFIGDREVYSLELGLGLKITDRVEAELGVKGFAIVGAKSSISPFDKSDFTGIATDFRIVGLF